MKKLDMAELRSKIDVDGLYVDYGVLRSVLSVEDVAKDSEVQLSEPTVEGECRGNCPKCKKEKSLALNINTSRFKCFSKGCNLKGGGVIDFFSKVNDVSAKESSHLLACAYGIQPYSPEPAAEHIGKPQSQVKRNAAVPPDANRGAVMRDEFEDLKARFDRLSNLVWKYMLEHDASEGVADQHDLN
jgi:hypothetical protein